MAKYQRKCRTKCIHLLIVASIITLNLVGISYCYWQDTLNINTSISTGTMNLEVVPNSSMSVELYPGDEADLHLQVVDRSSVPVVYAGYQSNLTSAENTSVGGISVSYDSGTVNIKVSPDQEAGTYHYNLELFYQSN